MPRDSQGNYSLPVGTLVNSGDTILVSQHNPFAQDVASSLSNSLDRNGSGGMRAPIEMNGFPVRNAANGTNPQDLATVAQTTINGVPVGAILDFGGTTAPAGFVLCNGQELSRSEYSELFDAIGIVYGAGNGSTTFNVPDARGRTSAGRDTEVNGSLANRLTSPRVNAANVGATGGAETHTLAAGEMPSHTHTGTTASAGSHTHSTTLPAKGVGGSDNPGDIAWNVRTSTNYGARSATTTASGAHTHSFTTNAAGSGQAHNNVQPTIIFSKIIKARTS